MKPGDRLDRLRIVTPCDVPWSSMMGDDQVRFCDRCRKNVYNVAEMTRAEAVALIDRAEGRVCMQIARRPDGTIVTGDCWARLRRARRRGILAFAAALPVVLVAQLWSQAFGLRALSGFFQRGPARAAAIRGTAEPPSKLPAAPPVFPDANRPLTGEIAFVDPPPAPKAPAKKRTLPRDPVEHVHTRGHAALK